MSDTTPTPARPDFVTDEHLDYLDELRESAVTNMVGAGPWLERDFGLDRDTARKVLRYWMATFGERHPPRKP